MTILKTAVSALSAELALIRAKIEIAKGNWSRFPAGSTKGGQFAPKGTSGFGAAKAPSFMFPGVGTMFKPSGPPKGAKPHPKVDENGKPVTINVPTKASDRSTWRDKNATATWTPGSKTPDILHGVPLKPWKAPTTTEGWSKVAGQNPKLDESLPFIPSPGKSIGAGVVIMEPDGRVWITKPTNEFGGYKHTFPKGTAERGLSLQANAIKEAWEESGLKVQIVGVLGDFERTTSKARFYIARRVGGTPSDMGWESQAMRLAPLKNSNSLLNMPVDRSIIANVKGIKIVKASGWTKQPRWPTGSSLGGQWKSYDSEGLPMPPKLGSASNPAYAKAADAAYAAAKSGDLSAAAKVAAKFAASDAAYKVSGGKGINYHGKEGAKTYQYVVDLMGATGNKTAVSAAAAKETGPVNLSTFTQTGSKPGGSNPGGMYEKGGEKFLVKGNAQLVQGNVNAAVSDDRARNEVLASKLMLAAGVGAPDMQLVDLEGKHGGGLGVASKWMAGSQFNPNFPSHVAAAQADFAVQAWLANHDVVGASFDNLKMVGGKAVNIDPGGALAYRAQGMPKGEMFGKAVVEMNTMRDASVNPQAAKVYGSMTQAQLQASAQKLAQVDDATIKALVDAHGPASAADKAALTEKLIARKQYVMGFVGLNADGSMPAPAKTVTAAPPVTATAAPAAATAVPSSAPKTTAGIQHMQAVYTLQDGKSNKFWGVTVNGNTLVTHYGKIGTKGSTTTKTFGSDLEANAAATKLTNEKLGKGYGYAGKNGAPQPVLDALSQAGFAAPKAPKASSGPPPEDMAVDTNPAVLPPQTRAPKASAAVGPGAFQAPPAILSKDTTTKQLAAMAVAIKSDVDDGKAPVVTNTASGIKIFTPAAGTHITIGNPPKTPAGKAILDYANAATKHIDAKQAAQDAVAVNAAQAAMAAVEQKPTVQNPPKAGQHTGNLPAMPDFEKAKLPTSNSNAQSHNAKVEKVAQLAAAGDVKGLLAQGYGSNTYGKQQAKLANSALAAMGVQATVVAGQKANTHPGINGGVSPDKASAILANAGTPVAATVTAPAAKGVVLKVPDNLLPAKTNYKGVNGGKGLSSKDWVNQQNEDIQAKIEQLTKSGNLAALQSLTFAVKDAGTGKDTGKVSGLSDHPSKNIKAYWNDSVNILRDLAQGPPQPLKVVDTTAVKSVADVSKHFPAKKPGTTVSKVKSNEKFGFWVALGSVTNPSIVQPPKTTKVSATAIAEAKMKHNSLSSDAKNFISAMQSSGSFADAYRNGMKTYGNLDLDKLAKAAKDAAVELPAGTSVYRWQNMPQSMLTQMEQTQPGLVFQATGPMPTSYSETATKSFGKHRIKIVYAKGAKAVMSFGSGGFSSEKEITTLPNSRFVLLKKDQVPDGEGGKRWEIEVLMLPPE